MAIRTIWCILSPKHDAGLLKIGDCGCFLITRELLRKVLRGKTPEEQDCHESIDSLRITLTEPN